MTAKKIRSADVDNTLVEWVCENLDSVAGTPAYKWLIPSHHKNLNHGDYSDRSAVATYLFSEPKGTK